MSMKRIVLTFVLATFSGNVAAEMVRIGENNRSIAYADASIRRSGDMAVMWVLFDYKSVQESPAVANGISRKRHSVKSIADPSESGSSFSRGMPSKWAMELSFTRGENPPIGSQRVLPEAMQTLFGNLPAARSKN